MRCAPLVIAALAGGILAGAAFGQQPGNQEGPVVVGERRDKWKSVELLKFDAALEFFGQYRSERLRQSGAADQTEREWLLRENLDLSTELAIGHKNLADVFGAAQFGLDRRTFNGSATGTNSSEWDFLNLYDLRAVLLGNGPVPVTPYTRREQSMFDQGFGGRVQQTTNESGIIAQIRSELAPTTLQYFHRRQEFDNPFGEPGSVTRQDTFTGQSGLRLSRNQHLDVAYTFDRINEDQGALYSDAFDRHDANLVHTLAFGPEAHTSELRSSLRLYDQGGRFEQNDTRWDELLTLRHNERLETRYSATIDDQTHAGRGQQLYRGEASVRHRLYQSLVSSASVGGQRLNSDENFRSDEVFTSAHFDYTKKVPRGRLDASTGVSYNAQDNSARGDPVGVLNDAHTVNVPLPIIISRGNIVPGSLVLLPTAGFPPYIEGIDYTVRYLPDRVEITIPPGSAIQDGQTLLADYTIGPEPASRINTIGTASSLRYTVTEGWARGISAYSQYRTSDQQLESTDPSRLVLDDYQDLILGLEYTRAGLNLRYEHENRWAEFNPFTSDRFQALYSQSIGRGSSVSGEYTHDEFEYHAESNRLSIDRVMGRWVQQISPRLDANVRLEYRNERNQLLGNTDAFDQVLGLNWHRGRTTVSVSVQNSFVNGPSSDRTSQLFQLGIKRNF